MSECRKTCPEMFLIKVLSTRSININADCRCIREACSRYYDEKCLTYEESFKKFMEGKYDR